MTNPTPEKNKKPESKNNVYELDPTLVGIDHRLKSADQQLQVVEYDTDKGINYTIEASDAKGDDKSVADLKIDKAGLLSGEVRDDYVTYVHSGGKNVIKLEDEIQLTPTDKVYVISKSLSGLVEAAVAVDPDEKAVAEVFQEIMNGPKDPSKAKSDSIAFNLENALKVDVNAKASSKSNGERAAQERKQRRRVFQENKKLNLPDGFTPAYSTAQTPYGPKNRRPDSAASPDDPSATKKMDAKKFAERKEALEGPEKELNEAREKLAVLSAKRQGRLFDRGSEGYLEAKKAYDQALINHGRIEMQHLLEDDADMDDDAKNKAAIEYIFNEQAMLRDKSREKLAGTPVSKFVDKFGNWLAKGSTATRIGKGVAVGAGGVLLGAGAGALAGVAGGVAVASGVAAVVSTTVRTAKHFAAHDAKQGRGISTLNEGIKSKAAEKTDDNKSDAVEANLGFFNERLEADTKIQQKRRRRSVGMAALAATAGAGIGGAIAWGVGEVDINTKNYKEVNDWANRGLDNIAGAQTVEPEPEPEYEWPKDRIGGYGTDDTELTTMSTGEGLNQTFTELGVTEAEHAQLLNDEAFKDIVNNYLADMRAGEVASGIENMPAAEIIDHGEGWNQTFSEHGASTAEQAALLNNEALMNRMCAMNLAYPAPELGGYGLYMTPDGKLPEAASSLIQAELAEIRSGVVATPDVVDGGQLPTAPGEVINGDTSHESGVDTAVESATAETNGREFTTLDISNSFRDQTGMELNPAAVDAMLRDNTLVDQMQSRDLLTRTDGKMLFKTDINGNLSQDAVQYIRDNMDRIDQIRLTSMVG